MSDWKPQPLGFNRKTYVDGRKNLLYKRFKRRVSCQYSLLIRLSSVIDKLIIGCSKDETRAFTCKWIKKCIQVFQSIVVNGTPSRFSCNLKIESCVDYRKFFPDSVNLNFSLTNRTRNFAREKKLLSFFMEWEKVATRDFSERGSCRMKVGGKVFVRLIASSITQ